MGMKYFLLNADSLNFKSKVSYARLELSPHLCHFFETNIKKVYNSDSFSQRIFFLLFLCRSWLIVINAVG